MKISYQDPVITQIVAMFGNFRFYANEIPVRFPISAPNKSIEEFILSSPERIDWGGTSISPERIIVNPRLGISYFHFSERYNPKGNSIINIIHAFTKENLTYTNVSAIMNGTDPSLPKGYRFLDTFRVKKDDTQRPIRNKGIQKQMISKCLRLMNINVDKVRNNLTFFPDDQNLQNTIGNFLSDIDSDSDMVRMILEQPLVLKTAMMYLKHIAEISKKAIQFLYNEYDIIPTEKLDPHMKRKSGLELFRMSYEFLSIASEYETKSEKLIPYLKPEEIEALNSSGL